MLAAKLLGRFWLFLTVLLLGGATAGCGSDGAETKRNGLDTASTPQVQEDPEASTRLAEALKKVRRGTAPHTVLTLFYYAQWGNFPLIVGLYDPAVRERIGGIRIATIYSQNQGRFLQVDVPQFVDERRVSEGIFLAVELETTDGNTIRESYLLRRRGDDWTVLYDTFFDRAIAQAARAAVDGSGKPSARGTRAALRASEEFRSLSLPD
jgi:hypothetical protein